jgi:urease accessory protein
MSPAFAAMSRITTTTTAAIATAPAAMADAAAADPAGALYRLAAWLSPAYPVGAYAYSHGLEWAVQAGEVRDRTSLTGWIAAVLTHGAGRADAILLAHAWADPADETLAELALALAGSRERRLETSAQGAAFAEVTAAAWPAPGLDGRPAPYPVAVGRAARAHGAPAFDAALLYLHGFAAALTGAALRLVPLGQTDGQRTVAALMETCRAVAAEAMTAPLDEIGGCALRSDIAAMRHETQDVRLFRT